MKALLEPIKEIARFDELFRDLKKGTAGVTVISGCLESQKAHMIAGLSEDAPVRLLIAENELKAKELYEDYRLYDAETLYYPAKDLIFYQADIHGNLLIRQRLQVIQALLERKEVTIITSVGGCMDFLLPLDVFEKHCIHLRNDSELDLDKIRKELVRLGYESTFQVESTGQFSVRGGILDIYPLTEQNPIRIELWGDEIDSIRSFDAESQRSIENLEEITIYPASELILTEDTIARGVKAIKKEVAAVALIVVGGLAFLSQHYTLDNIKSKTVGDGQYGTGNLRSDRRGRNSAGSGAVSSLFLSGDRLVS